MKILVLKEKLSYKDRKDFGLPELKKFPMPDREHVFLAIKYFNWAFKMHGIKAEKELVGNILSYMKKFNIYPGEISLPDTNRFKKYLIRE